MLGVVGVVGVLVIISNIEVTGHDKGAVDVENIISQIVNYRLAFI